MAHGELPSPAKHITANQAWTPLLLTAITTVIAVSLIAAIRRRQDAIPRLQAAWSSEDQRTVHVYLQAGSLPFHIKAWTVKEPWSFKGRPPRLQLKAEQKIDTQIEFRERFDEDCHLDVAIEIEDFGAWKQHLWLRAPRNASAEKFTKEEE